MASVGFGAGETDNYVLESAAECSLSNVGPYPFGSFVGVYGISQTLGSLSADDWFVFLSCLLCGVRHQPWVVQAVVCSASQIKLKVHGECHPLICTVDRRSLVSHDSCLSADT